MLTRVWVEDDQLVNTSSHFPPFKISLDFSESSKKNCSQLFGSPVNHLAHMSSTASSRVECSMRSYAKLISIAHTLYKHFLGQQAASDFPFFFLFLFFLPKNCPIQSKPVTSVRDLYQLLLELISAWQMKALLKSIVILPQDLDAIFSCVSCTSWAW